MNNITNQNKVGLPSKTIFTQPLDSMLFLSFFSPIIISLIMIFMSFIFQNFKGFIFLGFRIAATLLRNTLLYAFFTDSSKSVSALDLPSICNTVQYSKYGNSTFSAFVFAFTIMYILYPMIANGETNYWVISSLLIYFVIDIVIKFQKKCIVSFGELFFNVFMGGLLSGLIIMLMYAGGSSKYLFYNEMVKNGETCSMPSKQTFKCQVYKNGELVTN
jgi:hypothetical protein